MNNEEKALTKEPLIHEHIHMTNTTLGAYTEIGLSTFLENVEMDDYSYTGQFCYVQNAEIRKFSNIAAMVRIGPTDHPYERPSLHHFTYRQRMYGFSDHDDEAFFDLRASKKTIIGHDTWIGHGAIILPGVTIGNGAIIGSGAVVTKDVAPYTIVVGVPAKEIKKRFSPAIIAKLEEIQWWNWTHDQIKERIEDFHLPIDKFVEKHGER
jgi:phosphonate metabolism protein (transferase hexapeptide repeat family)